MNGAKEYALLFDSGRYGAFRIYSGEHARGRYFHLFLVTSIGETEVYGITGGHPGWTERYGWLHDGPWIEDFMAMVNAKRKHRLEVQAHAQKKSVAKLQSEAEKVTAILGAYVTERASTAELKQEENTCK